jgi:hypothetical protein
MATMHYCAFENTAADMRVSLDKLRELNELDELDQYERAGFNSLMRLCQKFLKAGEPLQTDCATDED